MLTLFSHFFRFINATISKKGKGIFDLERMSRFQKLLFNKQSQDFHSINYPKLFGIFFYLDCKVLEMFIFFSIIY